jgi:hypothetical protein
VDVLGDNIDTIKKNTGTLINASKGISLEVNADETKHIFRNLGITISNQNLVHVENDRRLKSGNAGTIQCRSFCLSMCCLKS